MNRRDHTIAFYGYSLVLFSLIVMIGFGVLMYVNDWKLKPKETELADNNI